MTPGKVNLSAHGDNSMTANNLGYNDCVDITGPAFTSENWFYVSMNPTMAEPQWSFSGLEWNYKNFGGYGNWQRLFGNGGKSCCTSTEWVAQARWWGVTVPDKGGIYTPMWGQLRGVLALDLHDNGTATWFNPSATKAGTYNSNVQFLAAFSPIRNYNNDQYAVFPLTSPSYQWSRTDCAQHYLTNRAFKGYPSEYLWSTKGSTSILPANLKPMAPLLKTLSINAKFCPGGGLSCTPLVFQKGTIEDSLFDGLIEAGMALSEAFASAIEAVYETLATMIEKNILSDSMVSDLATTGGDLEPMDLWYVFDHLLHAIIVKTTQFLTLAICPIFFRSMTASSVRAEASALKSSGFSGRISVTGSSDSATLVNSYTEDMAVDDFYAAGPLDAAGEAAALEDVGSASVDDIATDMLIDILV